MIRYKILFIKKPHKTEIKIKTLPNTHTQIEKMQKLDLRQKALSPTKGKKALPSNPERSSSFAHKYISPPYSTSGNMRNKISRLYTYADCGIFPRAFPGKYPGIPVTVPCETEQITRYAIKYSPVSLLRLQKRKNIRDVFVCRANKTKVARGTSRDLFVCCGKMSGGIFRRFHMWFRHK